MGYEKVMYKESMTENDKLVQVRGVGLPVSFKPILDCCNKIICNKRILKETTD